MSQENKEIEITPENIQKALSLLAWKNDSAREELVRDPKGAIEKYLGVKMDDKVKVNIVNHNDMNEMTFILPYNINKIADHELSDNELESAAGGGMGSTFGGWLFGKMGDGLISLGLPRTNASEKIGQFVGGGAEMLVKFAMK